MDNVLLRNGKQSMRHPDQITGLSESELLMKKSVLLFFSLFLFLQTGCTQKPDSPPSYTHISQEEAVKMMAKDDGHIIIDVRRQDEFDTGHIPGAVLIPNESIGTEPPAELPDKHQIILVYCRSGNRSSQAAQKLADMGYTNVYDFGGINTWKGEIVTDATISDTEPKPLSTEDPSGVE